MKLDWRNIDWSALAKSQVLIGHGVTLVAGAAAVAGFTLSPDRQSNLTNWLSMAAAFVAATGTLYSSFHRITAQAADATIIIPKKPTTPTA
jgi:pyridoxine/pyridoxamine 5'-phosphate oxidase